MKFGTFPLKECEGAILAHSVRLQDGRLAKGTRLDADTLARLEEAGKSEATVALLDPGDVPENEAAARIAAALAGSRIGAAPAATGRANLFAGEAGILLPDKATIDRLNALDPAITLATLPAYAPVDPGRMVATVKIIPLAVPGAVLDEAITLLSGGRALRLKPYRAHRVALIQTELPGLKASVLDKTRRVLEDRLAASGSEIVSERRVPHRQDSVAQAFRESSSADLIVVFGASAVIDIDDVVPAAVRDAGGRVRHLGMPVDPGNLLLLGALGTAKLLGAPGCARSPQENGFDWILNRLLADIEVMPKDIWPLGVGGLLMEIAARPQPREAETMSDEPVVAALVLAAGRSSRMGAANKLLATFDGVPLIRRSVETALASRAASVTVVVGHRADEMRAALEGLRVEVIDNPDYAEGLSTSLVAGFRASEGDGVLVMLADQPALTPAHLDAMIEAFAPAGEGSIVLATDDGRRRNPVLLSRSFAESVETLTGDVGARGIVAANGELVREVEIGAAASLDVDTPEAMARAGGVLAG
ncbi:NTP transferase domain-containing protein [Aureimonas mangrovi]|uniref:NTP transferase domain-containing protein n=1 Tax=Aureimonas mangrovi TaxID=2758041 RepID=UPI00163D5B88|nr:molybdopterin-binding/glycosyltransferase family 2 protein [Aureimonas mangrovi]